MSDEITKKTKLTIEMVILIIGVAISLTASWVRSEYLTGRNANAIIGLKLAQDAQAVISDGRYETLNGAVQEILVLNRISAATSASGRSDPWSGRMMEAHDSWWLQKLQAYHPELHNADTPDVLNIQKKYKGALEVE